MPKITVPKVKMFRCKTCRKWYNNPLTHVCRVKFTQANAKRLGRR